VMTTDPRTVDTDDSIQDAARVMRDGDVGDALVAKGGQVKGIVTDRDIAVRCVAEGKDPSGTPVSEVYTSNVVTLSPDQSVDEAIKLMRQNDVRRLPVVDGDGRPIGIVSLGDLAVDRDPDSALADISAASPNN
jgi:CBS domain-containing protein